MPSADAPSQSSGIDVNRLGHAAARGAAAVAVSQGIRVATQFLSVAILARLLTPKDFGLVAAIAPLTAFVVLIQDLGLQQALVQRPEISPDDLTRAFWFNVGAGLLCACAMVALAPGVALFFHDSRLTLLTIATAPSLAIATIGSVPTACLNRAMRFRMLAVIDSATALTVFAVAIFSAWLGMKYWALIIGTLSGSVVNLCGVWAAARWLPGRPSRQLPTRDMLKFGANLSGFNVLIFLARNLDNVLIGHVAGAVQLGFYDRAYKLLLFPLNNVNAPIGRLAIPLLSRVQTDKPRLRDAFLRIASQVALITIPGMAALLATADDTINLLFGPTWHAILPIFAWLGLASLVQPLTYAVSWLLIAQGRTEIMFRWGLYASTTTIAAFIVGLHWGAVGVACAYAVTDYVLRLPVLYWTVNRVGPVTALDLVKLQGPLLIAAGATALISIFLLRQHYGLGGLGLIAATVCVSYGFAVASMALLPRSRAALEESFRLFSHFGRRVYAP